MPEEMKELEGQKKKTKQDTRAGNCTGCNSYEHNETCSKKTGWQQGKKDSSGRVHRCFFDYYDFKHNLFIGRR